MSKKKKKHQEPVQKTIGGEVSSPVASDGGDSLSSTGLKTMAAGVVLVAVGFMVLSRADSMGRNWASTVSPFLILGGYAVVGWGIFRDDSPVPPPSQP